MKRRRRGQNSRMVEAICIAVLSSPPAPDRHGSRLSRKIYAVLKIFLVLPFRQTPPQNRHIKSLSTPIRYSVNAADWTASHFRARSAPFLTTDRHAERRAPQLISNPLATPAVDDRSPRRRRRPQLKSRPFAPPDCAPRGSDACIYIRTDYPLFCSVSRSYTT